MLVAGWGGVMNMASKFMLEWNLAACPKDRFFSLLISNYASDHYAKR